MAPQEEITLIDRDAIHAFAPSFLWLMIGDRKPKQITRPVERLLRPSIKMVKADVQGIDLASRSVRTGAGSLEYDYNLKRVIQAIARRGEVAT